MIALADCAVVVSNARDAARWWNETMGFAIHSIGEEGGHSLMVAPPGDRFVLHLCEGFGAPEPGNSGVAFVTDDFAALTARMEELGVEFTEPPHKESWGSVAKFADPDGNIFWLMEAPTQFIRAETRRIATSAPPKPAQTGGSRRPPSGAPKRPSPKRR